MQPGNDVLLVDDDPLINVINEQVIHRSNFAMNVASYRDAHEALDYLKKVADVEHARFPKIVFLDLAMPDMNGWEFLEEVNKFPETILNECKIIMLTSSIDEYDNRKSKEYKVVNDFITKPLTVDKVRTLFARQYDSVNNII